MNSITSEKFMIPQNCRRLRENGEKRHILPIPSSPYAASTNLGSYHITHKKTELQLKLRELSTCYLKLLKNAKTEMSVLEKQRKELVKFLQDYPQLEPQLPIELSNFMKLDVLLTRYTAVKNEVTPFGLRAQEILKRSYQQVHFFIRAYPIFMPHLPNKEKIEGMKEMIVQQQKKWIQECAPFYNRSLSLVGFYALRPENSFNSLIDDYLEAIYTSSFYPESKNHKDERWRNLEEFIGEHPEFIKELPKAYRKKLSHKHSNLAKEKKIYSPANN